MFNKKEYFYATIVKVGKFTTYEYGGRGNIFPSKKGSYGMTVHREISVRINGEIHNLDLQATHKTLQDIVDLNVNDKVMCYKKGKYYGIVDDLVKYKVEKHK